MTAADTDADTGFDVLLEHLKEQRGFDFTGYKRASLVRRFRRRLDAVGVGSFEEYLDYLQVHPDEFTALFNTILINVTAFFRDQDAWDELSAHVVPSLLAATGSRPLRVWSAGCSSGEEAYSLAIVMAEALGVEGFRERVKIYATDVDEEALAVARQATYSERDLSVVEPTLVSKYFEPAGTRFAFSKELRRCVIFGRNDLVQDAPISHVDLLACRNTLMYFNSEVQSQIVNRLHFALNPEGVLFLGKAEMLLSHGDLFAPVDLKRRFFRKVAAPRGRERRLPLAAGEPTDASAVFDRVRQEALLSSPVAQVVLDADNRFALANHRAEALFGLSDRDLGRPFQDLEVSYRPVELRSYIDEAVRDRRPVWVRDVLWHRSPTESLSLDVQIMPLYGEAITHIGATLIFHDVTRYRQLQKELEYTNRQLETAYEELQSTNEELETTNEELQSTVEELETTNEELQSTNEELETMNEELQSMNDELQTSNDELRQRTTEVSELNAFMEAVMSGLHAGVAVVDKDFRVLAWNDRAADLWGVRQDEAVGAHLMTLDIGLPLAEIRPLVTRQLAESGNGEHQGIRLSAVNRRGRPVDLTVTVTPLRTGDGQPSGAILLMDADD